MNDISFHDQIHDVFETGVKLKRAMENKGLRRARATCPRCGSWLHGTLNGPGKHLRMACEGNCGMAMME
ncbi:MAG: hypothetical protein RLO21_13770 [Nitratireductor sp.]